MQMRMTESRRRKADRAAAARHAEDRLNPTLRGVRTCIHVLDQVAMSLLAWPVKNTGFTRRYHPTRILLAACLLLPLLLLASCTPQEAKEQQPRVVVVLFDTSGSTQAADTRQLYYHDFVEVAEKLKGGDTLIADIITSNSLATASFPVRMILPRYNAFEENRLVFQQQQQRALNEVKAGAKRLIDTATETPHTDLLGAVQLVEKVFSNEAYRRGTVKALIIFSDMVQQMPDYDFSAIELTPERIEQIIETEREHRRLPVLNGVHVWVIGAARAAANHGLSPQRIQQIQVFWIAYFTACGANIDTSQYVPSLPNFTLPGE